MKDEKGRWGVMSDCAEKGPRWIGGNERKQEPFASRNRRLDKTRVCASHVSAPPAGASFALNGPTLGIPVASSNPGLRSVTGTAIETGVGSFLNGVRGVGTQPIELGLRNAGKIATEILPIAPELVGRIATGIGGAKLLIDFGIDLYAALGPCSQ